MKRLDTQRLLDWIKNTSNTLTSLIKLGGALKTIFLVLISCVAILGLSNISSKVIDLPPLPWWVIVIIGILTFYPIAKFIQWLFTINNVQHPFEYGGLLWIEEDEKLIPICPKCQCEILCREDSYEKDIPRKGSLFHTTPETQYFTICECPNHGKLELENKDLYSLKKGAESIYKHITHKLSTITICQDRHWG